MTEDELRELAGISPEPEVGFLGQKWKIRKDGLAALIRFALASGSDDPEAGTPPHVIHRLLEDCIVDFREFSMQATAQRASMEDLTGVINQMISWYCARSHWPAMRLIGYVAGNMQELDGQLIRSGGRGVAALSAREACNVALAACLEGRDEDAREMFMDDLMYEGDAASEALGRLREFQAQMAAAKEAASA